MISLYTYKLPFKKPFITARDTYTHREGVLIRYLDNTADLWSEAAPLPGFSPETLNEVGAYLADQLDELNGFFTSGFSESDLRNKLKDSSHFPSLQFALSYLGIRIMSHKNKRFPDSYLPFELSPEITLNDLLGISEPDQLYQEIGNSFKKGFRTIKIKAGSSPSDLARELKAASDSYPGLRFRIDANRSWPTDRVAEYSSYFTGLPVEYIEEPAAFSDLAELNELLNASHCPVALDESIHSTRQLRKIRKLHPGLFLVVKPALLGNLFDLAETIADFEGKRHRIVFSTLLESKIGREMTAFAAAKLGDPVLAHGLNTGRLFSEDLLPGFHANRGKIQVTECIREKRKQIRFQHLTLLNGIHS